MFKTKEKTPNRLPITSRTILGHLLQSPYFVHLTSKVLKSCSIRGGSRTAATSKVELFVIIVNDWTSLTIITKNSTLDVAAVLDPPVKILQPAKYEWIIENRLLVPTKNFTIPSDLTTL